MEKLKIGLVSLLLPACSATTSCGNDVICGVINGGALIAEIYSQEPAKNCHELPKSKQGECFKKTEDLKRSLEKHTKK